ncbi:carboxylating nicotinate-nucleotide diphosphorylase [Lactobacillus sp. ESL0679]|uniref:carboxylating nicotinate-nucleotide diphosphorylase n=1 Tax=Lactobacillus sp. ESL0679 TaxID=2983209 RepID=UPI0023F77118|nr:carboxylating nicotinate-nucleotide diphosphorylase [Lactobacillus sp. ESL0679]MDF7683009.1 carboxylating nicotinate-nucleotide diphosphorylase [Lactobacillus sp. ESL0679]
MNNLLLRQKLISFLEEDLEKGDYSSQFLTGKKISGHFVAKQDGVICGQQVPQIAYDLLGQANYHPLVTDGTFVKKGMQIGEVTGDAAVILSAERVVLNLIQRMSGIATVVKKAIQLLDDDSIRITDTRKTAPGLRMFDKYAVRIGGGVNHRFGLTGGAMLKDNHVALMGGVQKAITALKAVQGPLTPIEVEVESISELKEAIAAKPTTIMFDNQTPATIKKWVQLVPNEIVTEISGGVNLTNLASYRGCGTDYISMGCLTNDVTPIDISFLVQGVYKSGAIK